jgi:geranylgeranyl pyrophosphate synthase
MVRSQAWGACRIGIAIVAMAIAAALCGSGPKYPPTMNPISDTNFTLFVDAVHARVNSLTHRSNLHREQRKLVSTLLSRMRQRTASAGHVQPLGLLYWVVRAWGTTCSEQAVWLGAFGTLCICSIDLFDDVQDEDLAGKPCESVGPPIATNTALALLFLALDALRHGQELEQRADLQTAYLAAFNRISLHGVACQHQDLMGPRGARTSREVLQRDSGKTALVTLFLECGALLSGCSPEAVTRYRAIGGKLAALIQIVDDLRDIYAKTQSPDLQTGKFTFPLACFNEMASASDRDRLTALIKQLPASLADIGQLLYDSGAVERCALTIDELRREIHDELVLIGNAHGAHRVLLRMVDELAQSIYGIENLESKSSFWQPRGAFHDALTRAKRDFETRTDAWGCPALPALVPWSQFHFFSQPDLALCFYPDLDDLPEEVLHPHAALLGVSSLEVARAALLEQADFSIAHEMFHFWRQHVGRVSVDHWHEEYVCDRLALSYLQSYRPDLVEPLLLLCRDIAEQHGAAFSPSSNALLDSCVEATQEQQCDLGATETAVWHALGLLRLAQQQEDFGCELSRWLGVALDRVTAA